MPLATNSAASSEPKPCLRLGQERMERFMEPLQLVAVLLVTGTPIQARKSSLYRLIFRRELGRRSV